MSKNVVTIEKDAFKWCNLNSIEIPKSVVSIGDYLFYENKNLKSAAIYASLSYISNALFGECVNLVKVTIAGKPTSIGYSVFEGCENLESLVLDFSNVRSIGSNAFCICKKLKNIQIPNEITVINKGSFASCKMMKSIIIPNTVTSIGNSAFYKCDNAITIKIPNSVISIGDDAFGYCSRVINFTIPDSLISIGRTAFANYFHDDTLILKLPSKLTKINNSILFTCTLKRVIIPPSVVEICDFAFDSLYCRGKLNFLHLLYQLASMHFGVAVP